VVFQNDKEPFLSLLFRAQDALGEATAFGSSLIEIQEINKLHRTIFKNLFSGLLLYMIVHSFYLFNGCGY
jgi:hypothetical protein